MRQPRLKGMDREEGSPGKKDRQRNQSHIKFNGNFPHQSSSFSLSLFICPKTRTKCKNRKGSEHPKGLKPWQWGEPCHCHLFPGVPLCGSTLWCHCQHCPHPLLSPGPHPGALPARLQQQSLLHHVLHAILTGPATAAQRHAAVPTAPIPTVPAPAEAVQPARYQMCPPTTDVPQNWGQWEPGL